MVENKAIFNEFLDRMTINVSEFWRNPNRWEILERDFIPEMLQQNQRLKCWSAACSSGEEPYSLAMILDNYGVFQNHKLLPRIIDEEILQKAKDGVYIERSIRDVPQIVFEKYFYKQELSYHIN